MTLSLCETCRHVRQIISGSGSRFLMCQVSLEDGRYPKYPPQPVSRCEVFEPAKDPAMPAAADDNDTKPDALRLDQFLKLNGITGTGGQAKLMIQSGDVQVNGIVETRRRRKLLAGDKVDAAGRTWIVPTQ